MPINKHYAVPGQPAVIVYKDGVPSARWPLDAGPGAHACAAEWAQQYGGEVHEYDGSLENSDAWHYDADARQLRDGNGLPVASDVGPADARTILSMQRALFEMVDTVPRTGAVADAYNDCARISLAGLRGEMCPAEDAAAEDPEAERIGEVLTRFLSYEAQAFHEDTPIDLADLCTFIGEVRQDLKRAMLSRDLATLPTAAELRIHIKNGGVTDVEASTELKGLTIVTLDYDNDFTARGLLHMVNAAPDGEEENFRPVYVVEQTPMVRALPPILDAEDDQFDAMFEED
ncbi:hypothetical protein CPT_Sansa107 [Caulobacter phage Sansa]|uniref:Uncharacterized protein n=1 Tax=Caulobacter phage Sansa TaxID=1675600 RepID=A0A0K1LLY1_9CAUD|nr:hypothetical protein HOR07_gp107 [Caulobacter phage Sansa]AKU43511.1 hypothetical protein CPT_Sansa107 [Caulobacter phage Sansa]